MIRPYYEDAAVQLFHADCSELLPQLGQVDHVITDPPYDEHTHSRQRRGSAEPGKGKQFGLGKASISVERFIGFEALTADQMVDLSREFARLASRWVIVFCAMEQQTHWQTALIGHGMEHVRFGVWHKPGSTPQFTGDRPGTACEAIEVAHRPGKKKWNGGGGFGFWVAPIVKAQTGERCHPTQKPETLMAALVGDFTDPGDLILDPFGGSGTTAVAAKRLGRRCIVIEREEKYCEVAAQRLRQSALDLWAPGTAAGAVDPSDGRTGTPTPRDGQSDLLSGS